MVGPLMGGSPISPVYFKKWQCPLSLFFKFSCRFKKKKQCRLSILRNVNVPCRYFSNVPDDFKGVQCRLSNLRKRRAALSNLRVKGPHGEKRVRDLRE